MQSKLLLFNIALNRYRTKIFMVLIVVTLLALLLAPSMLVSAGRAVSTGG